MESKRNETSGNVIFSTDKTWETWTYAKARNRRPGGRGRAYPLGAPSTLVGPLLLHQRTPSSWGPCCSTDVLLPPIYTYVPPNYQIWSQKPNSTAATFCTRESPSWSLFRCSAGGGIDHGGLLHHRQGPSDEL